MAVPRYKGLKIEAILHKMSEHPGMMDYLPDPQDVHKLPRQFLCNLAYTKLGKPFQDFVQATLDHRHLEMAEKKDLLIAMDSEIAKVFVQSKSISSKYLLPVCFLSAQLMPHLHLTSVCEL